MNIDMGMETATDIFLAGLRPLLFIFCYYEYKITQNKFWLVRKLAHADSSLVRLHSIKCCSYQSDHLVSNIS